MIVKIHTETKLGKKGASSTTWQEVDTVEAVENSISEGLALIAYAFAKVNPAEALLVALWVEDVLAGVHKGEKAFSKYFGEKIGTITITIKD